MTKKKKILLIFVFAIVIIIAVCFMFIKKVDGKFSYSLSAKDEKFGVVVDSPILFRKVEIVQYYKNEDGKVELVLSNYHLDSFDEYVNPDFPEDIKSEVFYSNDIKFSKYNISDEVIKAIVYSDKVEKISLDEFDLENDISNYNLVYEKGALVTASNEWEPGEIKVSYYYVDPTKEYSIKSLVNNNTINYSPFINIESK